MGRPILLGTERYFASMSVGKGEDSEKEKVELPAHPEEEQVGKDTNRSFVSYPRGKLLYHCSEDVLIVGIPPEAKTEMKADLHDLIIGVLRQYPTLSYFQVSPSSVSRAGLMRRGTTTSCRYCTSHTYRYHLQNSGHPDRQDGT